MWLYYFLKMKIRNLPILANMQPETASAALVFGMCRIAVRNGPYRTAIQLVWACKTRRFARQNAPFRNLLNIRCLDKMPLAAVFNIKKLMDVRKLPYSFERRSACLFLSQCQSLSLALS